MERVAVGGEVRAEGRTITGTVMQFGELSPSHRERFLPGSLVRQENTWLDIDHEKLAVVTWEGAGLTFEEDDTALRMRAVVPRTLPGEEALAGVRSGRRAGLSVEFDALEERREPQTGIRIIARAALAGIGLVEKSSYPSAGAEVRARINRRIKGEVKTRRDIPCRCRAGCDKIRFEEIAFGDALQEVEDGDRVVNAFLSGSFDRPVASTSTGTLKLRVQDGALRADITGLPDTGPARDLVAGLRDNSVSYVMRVYFRDDESVVEVLGRTAHVRRAALRGVEIAALSGPVAGLEPIVLGGERRGKRRRCWL